MLWLYWLLLLFSSISQTVLIQIHIKMDLPLTQQKELSKVENPSLLAQLESEMLMLL